MCMTFSGVAEVPVGAGAKGSPVICKKQVKCHMSRVSYTFLSLNLTSIHATPQVSHFW